MENLLRQILAVQTDILAELRLLRQAVSAGSPALSARQPVPEAQAAPAEDRPRPAPSTPEPLPPRPEPAPAASRPSGMMTMDELADLGGQFLDAGARPKSRTKPVDASDLGGSLLDGIKAKNRAKRDAFAEFDRLHRDR